jgi:O-antigen/teichoic acid export membrane protein
MSSNQRQFSAETQRGVETMAVESIYGSTQVSTKTSERARVPFSTNTALAIAAQIVRYGFTLATWTIIARLLGPKALGEVQAAYLVPGSVLLLTNFGLPIANIYFLSKRAYSLPQILGNVLLRWLIESCAVVPLLLLARGLVLKYIPLSTDVYFVVVAWIPLQILNSYLTSVLTAQMRFYQQLWISVAQGIAVLIAVLVAVVGLGLDAAGAVAGLAIATCIVVLLELWLVRDGCVMHGMQPPFTLIRECLRFGIRGYFANLAQFVTYRFDSFIISYLLGMSALGIYAAAYTVAEMFSYLPSCLATVVFPATAASTIEEANWRTARVSRMTFAFVVFASIIGAAVAPWIYPAILGSQFTYSVVLFWALLPGSIMLAGTKIITADLLGRGFPQYASRGSSCGMVAIVILDVFLIPRYGLMAAAVSSSVVYGCQAVYWVRCLVRVTGLKMSDLLVPAPGDLNAITGLLSARTRSLRLRLRSLLATTI